MSLPPIVALEIGTSHVRAVVGEVREDGQLLVTGVGECASRGIRKSEVVEFDTALSCVQTALHLAEENARTVIHQVLLSFSGGDVRGMVNRGTVPIDDDSGEVQPHDITHVTKTARRVSLPEDREILHSISQRFYVDEQQGVTNPLGLVGAKLALEALILHARRNALQTVVKLVRSANVDVLDIAFGGLCSALAVLHPDEKEAGALVIDLCGGTTDYVVYARGAIAMAGSFAVGGDHLTNDLARGLRLPLPEAERLKEEHGNAASHGPQRAQKVSIRMPMGPERLIRLSDLYTIISLRAEETLMLVRKQLAAQDLLSALPSGVFLTGGGSRLKGMRYLVERVFGLPCTIGQPRGVNGLATATGDLDFAATVGLLRYAAQTQHRHAIGERVARWWRRLLGRGG